MILVRVQFSLNFKEFGSQITITGHLTLLIHIDIISHGYTDQEIKNVSIFPLI